jgi:hypothetical protein
MQASLFRLLDQVLMILGSLGSVNSPEQLSGAAPRDQLITNRQQLLQIESPAIAAFQRIHINPFSPQNLSSFLPVLGQGA